MFLHQKLNIPRILISSVIVVFAGGLIAILLITNRDFDEHNDPHEYAHIGKSVWSGDGLRYNGVTDVVLPPGFPVIIGAVNTLIDDLEWSGKFVSVISFLLSLVVMYRISLFVFLDEINSKVTVLLFAANSNILFNATNGYSESLFTLVFLVLVWITMTPAKLQTVWLSIFFVILWSFLYYVRPEGLIVGFILFGWFVIDSKSKPKIAWLMPFLFVILAFPYLFFLKSYTGNWQLSGKTYANLVLGELNSPYQHWPNQTTAGLPRYQIIEQIWSDPAKAKTIDKYLEDPENDIFQRLPKNLKTLSLVYWHSFSIFGIALMVLGFAKMNSRKRSFFLSLLLPMLVYLFFFIIHRMVTIYYWIGVIFIISGLKNMKLFIESKFFQKHADKLFWAVAILIASYQIRSVVKVAYIFLT